MATVNDLLDRKISGEIFSVSGDTSASEAAATMAGRRIGVLVCRGDGGAMVGVLSERDIVRAVARRPEALPDLTARDLITSEVETCAATDDLKSVIKRMGIGGFRHMPVVDGAQIIGVISVTDIFRYYADHEPKEQVSILAAYSMMSIP